MNQSTNSNLFINTTNKEISGINIDDILDKFTSLTDKEIILEVSKLFKEPKKTVLEKIMIKLEKAHFLALVEKTIRIQIEGGRFYNKIIKNKILPNVLDINTQQKTNVNNQNSRAIQILKSAGGVFFSLVKEECNLSKDEIKEIFSPQEERKLYRQQNKIANDIQKLLI